MFLLLVVLVSQFLAFCKSCSISSAFILPTAQCCHYFRATCSREFIFTKHRCYPLLCPLAPSCFALLTSPCLDHALCIALGFCLLDLLCTTCDIHLGLPSRLASSLQPSSPARLSTDFPPAPYAVFLWHLVAITLRPPLASSICASYLHYLWVVSTHPDAADCRVWDAVV